MKLSERERIVFRMLKRNKMISADGILKELEGKDVAINGARQTHSLSVMMKYLTAKACQTGWIISMVDGGQGAGNKASYSMEKRF
jgi:hypothetical protein